MLRFPCVTSAVALILYAAVLLLTEVTGVYVLAAEVVKLEIVGARLSTLTVKFFAALYSKLS
jgi:hypothetical protein